MIRPGQAMPLVNVYRNFRRYLDKAGIPHTGHGPRVHDFRHTYCVNLLRKWSEEGKDLMAYIPYMRTMLGHEGFEETAYYLKLTSEMYPFIRECLKSSFPNLIEEVVFEENEFY
jgi:integrase